MEEPNIYKYKKTYRKKIGTQIFQQCYICKEWKSINDFSRDNRKILLEDGTVKHDSGRVCKCKECQSKYFKEWYKKNRDYKIAYEIAKDKRKRGKDVKIIRKIDNQTESAKVFAKFRKEHFDKLERKFKSQGKKRKSILQKILNIWKS